LHAFEVKKYIPVVFQVAGLVWSWGLCVRFAGCWLTKIKFMLPCHL